MMSFVSNSFACLMFRDGKVTIIGTRCDMGIDTESAYRHCVAAELGMKYEDVLIQEQRSDNSAYCLAQPAGSSGTVNATPQLVAAASEMKQQILERAATPMPGSCWSVRSVQGRFNENRKISTFRTAWFSKRPIRTRRGLSARLPADS